MNNLFAQSRSHWVRYDRYEIKTGKDGKRYITPEKTAKPDVYNPLKESSEMVLEALNVGMLMMNRSLEDEVEKAIMAFVTHYGLLGLMTALPTTPSFMDYEKVYLPKNHFIRAESMVSVFSQPYPLMSPTQSVVRLFSQWERMKLASSPTPSGYCEILYCSSSGVSTWPKVPHT